MKTSGADVIFVTSLEFLSCRWRVVSTVKMNNFGNEDIEILLIIFIDGVMALRRIFEEATT